MNETPNSTGQGSDHRPAPPPARRPDNRQFASATERNRDAILAVLERVLPETGRVIEIGAGSGQHAAYFAPRFPGLTWQPTEPDPDGRASIKAWVEAANVPNLRPPLDLDVTASVWPITEADAVFSANMIHIAPWACCLGLMAGAGRILNEGGVLVLYGPFKRDGEHTAPSNADFDAGLKNRDPAWGVRDLGEVTRAAKEAGLALGETVAMPANNLIAIFRR
jgi:SAM-dependent methyltransferase